MNRPDVGKVMSVDQWGARDPFGAVSKWLCHWMAEIHAGFTKKKKKRKERRKKKKEISCSWAVKPISGAS